MADVGSGLVFTFEHPRELEAVLSMLAPVARGPRMVVIEGERGIGKTTVWRAAIDALRADRIDVRSACCTPTDALLSLTTLAELLSPFEGPALQALPERLRETLLVGAFRRVPDRPIEPALLVAATRRFLEELSSSGSLVLAIDDLPWLDRSTARVLGAALRQVERETPLALLVTAPTGALEERSQPVASLPPEAIERVCVRGWPRRALERLLHERFDARLSRPAYDAILEAAHGNPSFAIEIARGILERGGRVEPGAPLPVPSDLQHSLATRVAALPLRTRRVLLPAALTPHPTVALLSRTAGVGGAELDRALRRASAEGVVEVVGDEVRFLHPLFRSLLAEDMPETERRKAHRRLAGATSDPEVRARHLALATVGRSERIAEAIEEGARWSAARGTPGTSADLFMAAAGCTPTADRRRAARRRREASRNLVRAGRATEAVALLRDHVADAVSVTERARDLLELGRVSFAEDPALVLEPLEELAADTPALPGNLAVELHTFLAWSHAAGSTIADAVPHASQAVALAERGSDQSLLAAALAVGAIVDLRTGRPPERAVLERVLSLEIPRGRFTIADDPVTEAAWVLQATGDHAQAQRLLRQRLVRARASRDEASTSALLSRLAVADLTVGRWPKAEARLRESVRLEREMGVRPAMNLALLAWLEAGRGLGEAAIRHAEEARSAASDRRAERPAVMCEGALGYVLFVGGDVMAASEQFALATTRIRELRHIDPFMLRFVADAIEAHLAAGHEGMARSDAACLARRMRRFGTEARGVADRVRGLVVAADGDLERATALLTSAVRDHAAVANPFDQARSLLGLGSVERRSRRYGAARATIDHARALFDELGAGAWSARCDRERARVSGRAPEDGSITPGDRQIVALVAQGRTNREIAQQLFLSVSTVESHLRSIYRTVGVRTRAELAAQAMRDETLLPPALR